MDWSAGEVGAHGSGGLAVRLDPGLRAEHVGPEVVDGDRALGGCGDRGALVRGDLAPGLPVAHDVLANTDGGGQLPDPACLFDHESECVHGSIITLRDPVVNTSRVRPASRRVNNGRMSFAQNLKRYRMAAGLTQEELALRCGWSGQSRIANYESTAKSAREPRVSEVLIIAKALGVSVGELFGEPPPASHSVGFDPVKLSESIAALRQVARNHGWSYDPETHPDVTLYAYTLRCAMPETLSTAQVIDFGQKVAERLQRDHRGEVSAGQSDGGTSRKAHRKRA